jgi:autotransporter passenger strand-loop-strand repeat protein
MTTQFVSSGIVSSGIVVTSGNSLKVLSGGTANATSVTSGGVQQIDAGGSAARTVVLHGGFESVVGSATQITNYGSVSIDAGGSASFATVSGGGMVELGRVPASNGTHTANITLLGQYVTANFTKQSDGMGGTLVGDPPVVGQSDSASATLIATHNT